MLISEKEIDAMSVLALAHMGDCVYELRVRRMLCCSGILKVAELHKDTVRLVCAKAQAKAAKRILPLLREEELRVYKRGRNAHSHAAPRNTSAGEYHAATGLETLFGWLYLRQEEERIEELFAAAMEDDA